jgi:hypothetical protein
MLWKIRVLVLIDGIFLYEMLVVGLHGGDFLHTKTLLGWGMQAKISTLYKNKTLPCRERFVFMFLVGH